jgi:uncharacterized protein YggE
MSRFLKILPALALAGLLALPSHAQDASSSERTVRVSGEATVKAVPDQATVRFGIVSEAETAEAARAQNAEAARRAMNAVRELDVPEEKMRMESLRLQPRYEYDPQTDRRKEDGYEATRQVVVELTDLEQLPTLVARVVQQGANRLEGINYELSDRSSIRNEALRTAASNARDKARLLVGALDASLGPVRQISEESFGFDEPQPRVRMAFAKSAEANAEPEPDAYAAGEIEVTARVQVVFELVAE